jgi:hypothetical protein
MKKCFKCGEVKSLSEFYRHKQMADGHLNKCKECNKINVKKNRKDNIEHYREYDKKRDSLSYRIEMKRNYQKTDKGKESIKKTRKKYKENNPIKIGVHVMTGNAIRDGRLTKGNCEICGVDKVHAHHDDYSMPFKVRWLCPLHHKQWHDENGEGLNAS